MDKAKLAAAFNEWMRRYTEHPENFQSEWQQLENAIRQENGGIQPTHGQVGAEFLLKLME